VPQLLNVIKRIVDESPQKPQYFMTGSQNLSMLSTVFESMAGRIGILQLDPMTIYEQLDMADAPVWLYRYLEDPQNMKSYITGVMSDLQLTTVLWRGGMPGLLDIPDQFLHRYLSTYVKTYIDRDVRLASDVDDIDSFTDFFGIVAALTAQELNYDHLGREIGVAGSKAKKWLTSLQQGYQWRSIPAYDGNAIKRVVKKRKGYIADTALACYMQQIQSPHALMAHPLRGALFETFVVNTIEALLNALPSKPKLYHWRSDGGAEVDLIIAMDNKLYPIAIKMTSRLSGHDTRGLRAFRETYKNHEVKVMPGLIIYVGQDCYRLDEDTLALPWNCLAR